MKIAVIGLGNTLLQDEGAGVHALRLLRENFQHPDVELYDGGTKGLTLLAYMEEADGLLLLDAVACDAAPGTILEYSQEELFSARRPLQVSAHDIALADLLTLLALRRNGGGLRVHLIGIVPASLELSENPSEEIRPGIAKMAERAKRIAEQWLREWTPLRGSKSSVEIARL